VLTVPSRIRPRTNRVLRNIAALLYAVDTDSGIGRAYCIRSGENPVFFLFSRKPGTNAGKRYGNVRKPTEEESGMIFCNETFRCTVFVERRRRRRRAKPKQQKSNNRAPFFFFFFCPYYFFLFFHPRRVYSRVIIYYVCVCVCL